MVLAYDQLSDEVKEKITGRVAVHDIARVFAGRLNMTEDELREVPMEHPVVRTHPETGRNVLYVNVAFTTHIKIWTRPRVMRSVDLFRSLESRITVSI